MRISFLSLLLIGALIGCQRPADADISPEVLWHQDKDSGTPLSHSLALAHQNKQLVILVGTSGKYSDQSVAHAQKLAGWFQEQEEIALVSVVAHKMTEEGVFIVYCMPDGLPYKHKGLAPNGTLTVQNSIQVREDAVQSYRAALAIRERKSGYLD
ncbi:MAG: hypothetical protein AAGH40_10810 [Verrucomicrobiota bacterium]